MPSEVEIASTSSDSRRVLGALLFTASLTNTIDVYSALNSSPWTAENFGADENKAESCREYVKHSIAVSLGFAVAAGMIAKSWWPVLGAIGANGYMYWLYERALARGNVTGSDGWVKK